MATSLTEPSVITFSLEDCPYITLADVAETTAETILVMARCPNDCSNRNMWIADQCTQRQQRVRAFIDRSRPATPKEYTIYCLVCEILRERLGLQVRLL